MDLHIHYGCIILYLPVLTAGRFHTPAVVEFTEILVKGSRDIIPIADLVKSINTH